MNEEKLLPFAGYPRACWPQRIAHWLAYSKWGYPWCKHQLKILLGREGFKLTADHMIDKDDGLRALRLLWLKFRLAESDQVTRSDRSSWSCSALCVDVISLETFVSSAKAVIWLDLTTSGRDFTYRRNNMGPRIDPCGTPEVTGKGLDVAPNIVTRYWCSFHRSNSRDLLCQGLLTCPDNSTCTPLSSFVPIWSKTSKSWVTKDRSAMKPCWYALIRLKTWSLIAVNMHLSMTLGTIESSEIGL